MKKENGKKTIRFFGDATELGLPFIRVEEGEFEGLILMIDTGSNDNVMFGYAYSQLKDHMKLLDMTGTLYGIDGTPAEVRYASWEVMLCGKKYEMTFMVRDDDKAFMKLSHDVGFPVTGIIGTKFMAEHDWVIDFGKQEVQIPVTDISVDDLLRLNK